VRSASPTRSSRARAAVACRQVRTAAWAGHDHRVDGCRPTFRTRRCSSPISPARARGTMPFMRCSTPPGSCAPSSRTAWGSTRFRSLHFAYDDSIESGLRLSQLIDAAVATVARAQAAVLMPAPWPGARSGGWTGCCCSNKPPGRSSRRGAAACQVAVCGRKSRPHRHAGPACLGPTSESASARRPSRAIAARRPQGIHRDGVLRDRHRDRGREGEVIAEKAVGFTRADLERTLRSSSGSSRNCRRAIRH